VPAITIRAEANLIFTAKLTDIIAVLAELSSLGRRDERILSVNDLVYCKDLTFLNSRRGSLTPARPCDRTHHCQYQPIHVSPPLKRIRR